MTLTQLMPFPDETQRRHEASERLREAPTRGARLQRDRRRVLLIGAIAALAILVAGAVAWLLFTPPAPIAVPRATPTSNIEAPTATPTRQIVARFDLW